MVWSAGFGSRVPGEGETFPPSQWAQRERERDTPMVLMVLRCPVVLCCFGDRWIPKTWVFFFFFPFEPLHFCFGRASLKPSSHSKMESFLVPFNLTEQWHQIVPGWVGQPPSSTPVPLRLLTFTPSRRREPKRGWRRKGWPGAKRHSSLFFWCKRRIFLRNSFKHMSGRFSCIFFVFPILQMRWFTPRVTLFIVSDGYRSTSNRSRSRMCLPVAQRWRKNFLCRSFA